MFHAYHGIFFYCQTCRAFANFEPWVFLEKIQFRCTLDFKFTSRYSENSIEALGTLSPKSSKVQMWLTVVWRGEGRECFEFFSVAQRRNLDSSSEGREKNSTLSHFALNENGCFEQRVEWESCSVRRNPMTYWARRIAGAGPPFFPYFLSHSALYCLFANAQFGPD